MQEAPISLGPLTVDPANRRATVRGRELILPRKEFALLLALAGQPDRVFKKEELMVTVWGHVGTARTRTLESHASKLRSKLRKAGAPGFIISVHAIGYRLWDRPELAAVPRLRSASKAASPPGSLTEVV
jgi:DNA-binding response OmpR family regulator